jgi:hypothetical protein
MGGKDKGRVACPGCGVYGGRYVQKASRHSSDPKRIETSRVWEPCKVCGGNGLIG